MYIYVLLYYVCIQKPKVVPEAAIHLASTVLRQNSERCCCFGSWRDSQLEFKAQALTRAVNGPRAKLVLPFAVIRVDNRTGIHLGVRTGRVRTGHSEEFTLFLCPEHPRCLFLWKCCEVHLFVKVHLFFYIHIFFWLINCCRVFNFTSNSCRRF